jgi:hypothetical protein
MKRLPPPRFGAAGYERLGFALLAAATPPRLAPDYNKRRGALWAQCQARRTLPTSEQFAADAGDLRDMLRAVAARPAVAGDEAAMRALVRAARRLDVVEREGTAVGLLP